jgi:O-antigen ligase
MNTLQRTAIGVLFSGFLIAVGVSHSTAKWIGTVLLLWGIFSLVMGRQKFDREDRLFLLACLILPFIYVLNMAFTGWESRYLNRPVHLLATGLIYLLVRRKGISQKHLMIGIGLAGLSLLACSLQHVLQLGWNIESNRVRGEFSNAVPFGMFSATVLVLGICSWLESRKVKASAIPSWPVFLAIAGGLAGSVLSGTRTAWVAVPIVLLASQSLTLIPKKATHWVALGVAVLVLFSATQYPPIKERLSKGTREFTAFIQAPHSAEAINTSIGLRLHSWEWGVKKFLEQPLLGIGLAKFHSVKDDAATSGEVSIELKSFNGLHNAFVDHLAMTGITGTACLFIFWILLYRHFWSHRKSTEADKRLLSAWGMVLLTSQLISSLTGSLLSSSLNTLSFAVLLAFLAAAAHPKTEIRTG